MDPRDILRRGRDPEEAEDTLHILVDTASMNEEFASGNETASRVLQYAENREFWFVRTPETQRHEALERIPSYTIEEADNGRRIVSIDSDEQGELRCCLATKSRISVTSRRGFIPMTSTTM